MYINIYHVYELNMWVYIYIYNELFAFSIIVQHWNGADR